MRCARRARRSACSPRRRGRPPSRASSLGGSSGRRCHPLGRAAQSGKPSAALRLATMEEGRPASSIWSARRENQQGGACLWRQRRDPRSRDAGRPVDRLDRRDRRRGYVRELVPPCAGRRRTTTPSASACCRISRRRSPRAISCVTARTSNDQEAMLAITVSRETLPRLERGGGRLRRRDAAPALTTNCPKAPGFPRPSSLPGTTRRCARCASTRRSPISR